VEFEVTQGRKGPQAANVRPVELEVRSHCVLLESDRFEL